VLNIMGSGQKDYGVPIQRERSIENLSRDLDDRIAKIKQKYYETGNPNGCSFYEPSRKEGSDYKRWEASHIEERKGSSYMGDSLARSRANRESIRSSLYTPAYPARPMNYQYA
jgi:hypothetical protein